METLCKVKLGFCGAEISEQADSERSEKIGRVMLCQLAGTVPANNSKPTKKVCCVPCEIDNRIFIH